MQPPQLREFRLVAEIQGRPALAQDEAVRVVRDLPQRLDVARVLRAVDGGGQLVIRLQPTDSPPCDSSSLPYQVKEQSGKGRGRECGRLRDNRHRNLETADVVVPG